MTPQATIHVRSSDSGDAISVIEVCSDASFDGPPLHDHDFDEAFYVLDGELTFRLGDEVFTRRAGGDGLRATGQPPHAGEPVRRTGALPADLHAGRLRGAVRGRSLCGR